MNELLNKYYIIKIMWKIKFLKIALNLNDKNLKKDCFHQLEMSIPVNYLYNGFR